METGEKMMTGEDSLRLITEMINKTKANIRQGSFHLLFWGWLIFVCSFSEYLLFRLTGWQNVWVVWLLTIPGVFVSFIYAYIHGRRSKVFTYADMIYMWIWIGFLITAIILFLILSDAIETVSPFILVIAGYATFMSGFIIKFRPLIIGGITFWIFTVISHFAGPGFAPLAMPLAVLTGYLLPGYLLKRKVGHDTI